MQSYLSQWAQAEASIVNKDTSSAVGRGADWGVRGLLVAGVIGTVGAVMML